MFGIDLNTGGGGLSSRSSAGPATAGAGSVSVGGFNVPAWTGGGGGQALMMAAAFAAGFLLAKGLK